IPSCDIKAESSSLTSHKQELNTLSSIFIWHIDMTLENGTVPIKNTIEINMCKKFLSIAII
ncbi:MAG: hypothetical protein ACK44H_04215, partial [Candidatus Kryptonium sp.]